MLLEPNARVAAESLARRVADRLLADADDDLVDVRTGARHAVSDDLPASPDITFASPRNGWLYQNWLIIHGLDRLGSVLGESGYRAYGRARHDAFHRHLPFFRRQRAAGFATPPTAGDEPLAAVDYYLHLEDIWQTGLASFAAERALTEGEALDGAYFDRLAAFLDGHPRHEGLWVRAGKGVQNDDAYLGIAPLLRLARLRGRADWVETSVAQVLGYDAHLRDPATGLYHHLRPLGATTDGLSLWGRGNGWMTLAWIDLLEQLGLDHPRADAIRAGFTRHLAAICRHQGPGGAWHQVLDRPGSYAEGSCTGMFVYGLAFAHARGLADTADSARSGWTALAGMVDEAGRVRSVCRSCDVGDETYYRQRERADGNLHGYGPFLLAAAEMLGNSRAVTAG